MSTKTQTRKANQYAGTCATCGGHVPAGAGLLGDKVNGRWTVRHTDCTSPTGYVSRNQRRARYAHVQARQPAQPQRKGDPRWYGWSSLDEMLAHIDD